MEQAATRLLVRDQVESPLENGSLIVPAIILFPPEQPELIRQHLNPTTCLYCSSRREDQSQRHTSPDRASQRYASQGYRNPDSKDATSVSKRRLRIRQLHRHAGIAPAPQSQPRPPYFATQASSHIASPSPRSSQRMHRPRMHHENERRSQD
jgi:hypothetical protein